MRKGRRPTRYQVGWIHHGKTTLNGNPDSSLRITDDRSVSIDSFAAGQTVRRSKFADVSRSNLARQQFVSWDLQYMIGSRYPQSSLLVFRDAEYRLVQCVWQRGNQNP